MAKVKNFCRSESGSGTIMGLGTFLFAATVGGLALDYSQGNRENIRLQVAADAAALAAAANIDTFDNAQAIAAETVRRNLRDTTIIASTDVVFGRVNPETSAFEASSNPDEVDAVFVQAVRSDGRANSLPTLLMNIVGVDRFEMGVSSVAGARRGGGGGALAGCEDATFISQNQVNTGGGIDLDGAVCIHGKTGIRTGGGDTYDTEVRFSAPSADLIQINNFGPANLTREQLTFERTLEPVILPRLQQMHNDLWSDISVNCNWDYDPEKGDLAVDGLYTGNALPSFIGEGSAPNLVCMNNFHTFQPGELQANTVYLSRSGVQFAGGVKQNNVAIITKQGIGIGGGPGLAFDEVFFFGTQLNLAGNIAWGPSTGECSDDNYSVYTFGLDSLSLGGFARGTQVSNVVGAAPAFRPGGAMSGTGMYFESEKTIQLGGDLEITGCENSYTSEIEIADTRFPEATDATGSFLIK